MHNMKRFTHQILFAVVTLLFISCGTHNSRIKFQRTAKSAAPTASLPALEAEVFVVLKDTIRKKRKAYAGKQLIVQKEKRRKIKEKAFKPGFRSSIITNNDFKFKGKIDFVNSDTLSVTSKKNGTQNIALIDVHSFSRLSVTAYVFGGIIVGLASAASISMAVDFDAGVGLVLFGILGAPFLVLFLIKKRYKKSKWKMRIE